MCCSKHVQKGHGIIMEKRIYYIDCYKGETKERNIGFIKLEGNKIFLMLRGLPEQCESKCSIYVIGHKGNKIPAASVSIIRGYGQAEFAWPSEADSKNCLGLIIPLFDKYYGKCVINPIKIHESNINPVTTSNTGKCKINESNTRIGSISDKNEIADISPDKWSQLCSTYPQVHIFPEADTIVLKPKDMVVLTNEYQKLATNSFVLHSYYNYRQLLLLKYHISSKDSKSEDSVYYLGVPGVYYERERRIALMFGFEGFENGEARLVNESSRKAYTGCFGYYMKKVEI